ncbi:hypothetical protein NDU88_005306 [Pleurodeles waltl]|uniref:DUF4236 domain-containing protein n=1 Tax=Pleurodeles waltl TaxID=8319 RepID=A0AAV7RLR6_PLEWA|nr:hypothetical protein NDU88_005306 [Pleurodeles waltl]
MHDRIGPQHLHTQKKRTGFAINNRTKTGCVRVTLPAVYLLGGRLSIRNISQGLEAQSDIKLGQSEVRPPAGCVVPPIAGEHAQRS